MSLTRTPEAKIIEQRADWRCGKLKRTYIYVWWCGDDHCSCSQVRVIAEHQHTHDPHWLFTIEVAAGEFHTDGEGCDEVWEPDLAEARAAFPDALDIQSQERQP